MKNKLNALNWDKVDGLMPAVIQDFASCQVLMLGYMNKEALDLTLTSGKVTFYSRTKKRLWMKGETSNNELLVIDILPDCDNDTLLIQVKPSGPCCHLNTVSCFPDSPINIIQSLITLIATRYQSRPQNSYVTSLFTAGVARIAQKVGEEGVELALASVSDNKDNIANEAADLLFHLLVLLQQCQVDFHEVLMKLKNRQR